MHDGAGPNLIKNAPEIREHMTDAEKKVWEFLKSKPYGLKIRRQHPINIYILDFYCYKLRLAIEIDGGYHYNRERRIKDKERSRYLNCLGFKIHRFTNKQVLNDF